MFEEKKWKQGINLILDYVGEDLDREFTAKEIYEAGLKDFTSSFSSARGLLRTLVGWRHLKQRHARTRREKSPGRTPNLYSLTATGKIFRERYEEIKRVQLEKAEQLAEELNLNEEQYNLFLLYTSQGLIRIGKMPLEGMVV
ncbi:MAG: hypothetical protein ACE5OZ_07385 [Candidatus Heimdallarchaeota archaeon]